MLVYFGYPQAHEDDAERAVRAGLELIQAVGELKSSAHLQTRVGIATGIVVVGDRPPNASELAINFKRRELEETCRKLDGLIEAIADGFRAPGLRAKLDELEQTKSRLQSEIERAPEPSTRLHPNLAKLYRKKVARLQDALVDPVTKTEALEDGPVGLQGWLLTLRSYQAVPSFTRCPFSEKPYPQSTASAVAADAVAAALDELAALAAAEG